MIWIFWVAAASATAALIMSWRQARFTLAAALIAAALGVATLAASGWIADAGGKIRHPEIRGHALPPVDDESDGLSYRDHSCTKTGGFAQRF